MRAFVITALLMGLSVGPSTPARAQAQADSLSTPSTFVRQVQVSSSVARVRQRIAQLRGRPAVIYVPVAQGPAPSPSVASPQQAVTPTDLFLLEQDVLLRMDQRFDALEALLTQVARTGGIDVLSLPALTPPQAGPSNPAASVTRPPVLADAKPPTPVEAIPVRPLNLPARPVGTTPEYVEKIILETGLFRTIEVVFETDQSTLLAPSLQTLEALGEVLRRHPEIRMEVAGHTDSTGPESYNQRLSEARAERVRRYLIEQFGVAEERIAAKGYGEAYPIAGNDTATGRTLNRRVEFVVVGIDTNP